MSAERRRSAAWASAAALGVAVTAWTGIAFAYRGFHDGLLEAVRTELAQIARIAAASIDGEAHQALAFPADAGSQRHLQVVEPLARVHRSARGVIDVYTAVLRGNRIFFPVDSGPLYRSPDDRLPPDPPMSEYLGSDADLRRALETRSEVVNAQPVQEKHRVYLSAFAPFTDGQGRFAGVVGVDMTLETLGQRLAEGRRAARFAALVVGLVAALIGVVVFRLHRAARDSERQKDAALAEAIEMRRTAESAAMDAQQAGQARNRFFATMSHELRTPLNGMCGLAELLLVSPLNEAQRRQLRIIRDSGVALRRLIDDVLDFARLDAGRLGLEIRPADVRECVATVQALLEPQALERRIALGVQVAPDVPPVVRTDVLRLRQVLVNLVGNAVKFTESGRVDVRVECDPLAPAERLAFTVRDTGIGIAAEHLPTLFEDFAQADPSVARRYGGSGLGLAISRRLVTLLGGTIEARSEPGAGSTFRFTIAAPAAPADVLPASRSEGEPAAAATRRLRVLVVDDNSVNQLYAEAALHRLGHLVALASSGEEALQWLAGDADFDVVLLDLQMPGVDGFETARRIRALDAARGRTGRAIAALTASAMPDDRQACLDAGMNDLMAKPYRLGELAQLLRRIAPAPDPAVH